MTKDEKLGAVLRAIGDLENEVRKALKGIRLEIGEGHTILEQSASASLLAAKYGYWEEHPLYPVEDWLHEVANENTRNGYWEWVERRIEEDQNQRDLAIGEGDGNNNN